MPSKRQYDLVQNDDYDTRIPLHPEEAFHHGITFQAKYIGMLDVPRPTSKVEIVAAMRRIRYEFKAKGIKKKKVTIEVSVDGLKVMLRKKRKKKNWLDDGKSVLLNHPIYRVFYVSHDSQDLKIFSYIARDGAANVFKCAVFKSSKKSQAMRVVRTVGQAFEVCHKLSINNPENDHLDQDEQDTLTQDLLSDRLSDITSDKPKRDILSEGASDRVSLPPDDCSFRDLDTGKCIRTTGQLDVLPPPPNNINTKNIILKSAEMYSSPLSDGLTTGSAESGGSLPPPGTALSTHHELQLMREQLEQQTQQTQAALAQLQLAREQLAAEQAARLEAQARTHQLLIHNRELLDHIAALVGHLQGSEKSGQQPTPPHMTMPQQQSQHIPNGTSSSDMYEYADAANSMNFNLPGLPENRSSGSFVPASPLRSSFNPAGNVFNFAYPQSLEAATFENQLLQKLQALNALQQSNPFAYPFSQSLPYLLPNLYSPTLNGSLTLQNPPQKNVFVRPFAEGRHSEPRQINPNYFNQSPPSKKDEYYTKQGSDTYQQKESDSPIYQKIVPKSEVKAESSQRESSPNPLYQTISPRKQGEDCSKAKTQEKCPDRRSFIKPHSQIGTLTTTDSDGRLRVVVPVLSNSREDLSESFSNLRTDDRYKSLPRASDKCYYKSSNQQDTLVRHKTK